MQTLLLTHMLLADDGIRSRSTLGGAFELIAKNILQEGGIVCVQKVSRLLSRLNAAFVTTKAWLLKMVVAIISR